MQHTEKPLTAAIPPQTRQPRTLLVEDQGDMRVLIAAMLKSKGLACDSAATLAEARTLMKEIAYDIAFLDVNLPDGNGLALARECTGDTLTVVITGSGDLETAIEAIRGGAVDFIAKPFSVGDFLYRMDEVVEEWRSRSSIRYHAHVLEDLVRARTSELSETSRELNEVRDASVAALGAALNLKDHETADHCRRVSENSVQLGRFLSLSEPELRHLKWGAYLHDVGKIGIPERILLKPGELTREERAIVEKHPVMGSTMLRGIAFLRRATDVVLHHHERFDGTGYPERLSGTDIPLHARIFAVMDALDAMTSERPYRHPLDLAESRRNLESEAARQFDPEILEIFLRSSASFWVVQRRVCA